ncbi:MAG TPA: hypothetical protein VJ998_04540 [Pseudomonadales bacterium]|nr:hypothetical protein [Pseudomonadales bacterium]
MPFSVRVNEAKNIVTLVCWGDISVDDMMEYERRYWGGPEHEGFHHIVDLQVANLKIDYNQGLMLATHATPANLDAYKGARSALVVGNEETEIMCEAYRDARHAMCHPSIREIGVFQDMEQARLWLEESAVIRAHQD